MPFFKTNSIERKFKHCKLWGPEDSVVHPEKIFRIGEGRIQNEFEVKLLWKTGKIGQFFNKNAQFKNIILFCQKIFP